MRPASSGNTRYASSRSARRSAPAVESPRSTPTRTSKPGPMAAIGVPGDGRLLPTLTRCRRPITDRYPHYRCCQYAWRFWRHSPTYGYLWHMWVSVLICGTLRRICDSWWVIIRLIKSLLRVLWCWPSCWPPADPRRQPAASAPALKTYRHAMDQAPDDPGPGPGLQHLRQLRHRQCLRHALFLQVPRPALPAEAQPGGRTSRRFRPDGLDLHLPPEEGRALRRRPLLSGRARAGRWWPRISSTPSSASSTRRTSPRAPGSGRAASPDSRSGRRRAPTTTSP